MEEGSVNVYVPNTIYFKVNIFQSQYISKSI